MPTRSTVEVSWSLSRRRSQQNIFSMQLHMLCCSRCAFVLIYFCASASQSRGNAACQVEYSARCALSIGCPDYLQRLRFGSECFHIYLSLCSTVLHPGTAEERTSFMSQLFVLHSPGACCATVVLYHSRRHAQQPGACPTTKQYSFYVAAGRRPNNKTVQITWQC